MGKEQEEIKKLNAELKKFEEFGRRWRDLITHLGKDEKEENFYRELYELTQKQNY